MARKKKQAKSRRSRASIVRQDYRQGGRVSLAQGGRPKRSDFGPSSDGGHIEYKQALQAWEAGQPSSTTATPPPSTVPQSEIEKVETAIPSAPPPGTGASAPSPDPAPTPATPKPEDYTKPDPDNPQETIPDPDALAKAQEQYTREMESWNTAEALRRAKTYGQDGTTSATISDQIGTFGGSVTTPKADVATLTPEEGITEIGRASV